MNDNSNKSDAEWAMIDDITEKYLLWLVAIYTMLGLTSHSSHNALKVLKYFLTLHLCTLRLAST